MNDATLSALIGSIEKWMLIEYGVGYDEGWSNCPLCELFRDWDCIGCPVAGEDYARQHCSQTPYDQWDSHYKEKHPRARGKAVCSTCIVLAHKETEFLKRLLPKRNKP